DQGGGSDLGDGDVLLGDGGVDHLELASHIHVEGVDLAVADGGVGDLTVVPGHFQGSPRDVVGVQGDPPQFTGQSQELTQVGGRGEPGGGGDGRPGEGRV